MSGDVLLPPIGGVMTVTHGDVASSNSWEELPLREAGLPPHATCETRECYEASIGSRHHRAGVATSQVR